MNRKSILYGVQGTGNGHISRARLMAAEFDRLGVEVEFLFSGRASRQYFDMEWFANRRYGTGLSFVTQQGRLSKRKTIASNQLIHYAREVASLRTEHYDLVVTDFEPTVAWAAHLRGSPTLAIGHQYALHPSAPQPSGNMIARWLLRNFAPAENSVGFHWHPYSATTLPPMIETSLAPCRTDHSFTLVYLPFENQSEIVALLKRCTNEPFVVYSPQANGISQERNVSIYPLSRSGFVETLQRCSRVICNAGFELIAEALHLGLPVLTRPLAGQFEQLANAMALDQLQLATVQYQLDVSAIREFVRSCQPGPRTIYPNVARELARFCQEHAIKRQDPRQTKDQIQFEAREAIQAMAARLWSEVHQASISAATTANAKLQQSSAPLGKAAA